MTWLQIFSTDPNNKYEPHNYNLSENGPVTMRKALAGSLNIPAVKAIYLAGIDNVISLANKLGYTTLNDKNRFGLSLVLGGGEVSLLEHTNAYSAFSQDGVLHPISSILKVEDKDGKVLEEYKQQDNNAFDPQIARQITNILSDNNARAYIFGTNNSLTLGNRPVAAKTGTTNDYHDAWTIGYTPSLVTGVWAGNSDNAAMKRGADGSIVAGPIWHDYMKKVLDGTPIENFIAPTPVKTGKAVLDGLATSTNTIKIDRASGLLATDLTPLSFVEELNIGQPHDILYFVNKDDPRGPIPTNPAADPQYTLWETPVQAWAKKHNLLSTTTPPTEKDNLHIPTNQPTLSITEPLNNQSIIDPLLRVKINASAPRGVVRVEYYIDEKLLAIKNSLFFDLEKNVSFISNGEHTLKVIAYDDIDNATSQTLTLNFNLPKTTQVTPELNWVSTKQTISTDNFPLELKFAATNWESISKVTLFSQVGTAKPTIISSIAPVESPDITFILKNLQPNTYKLFGLTTPWDGEPIQTDQIVLTVTQSKSTTTPQKNSPLNRTPFNRHK